MGARGKCCSKANECGAEMIVVIKHHKTWLERTLTGSVAEQFFIDPAKQAVVVYHAEMPTSDDVISDEESSQSDAEGATSIVDRATRENQED